MARVAGSAAAPDRSSPACDRAVAQAWLREIDALDWSERSPRVAALVTSPRSGKRRTRAEATVVAGRGLAGDYERKDFYKGERQPGREVSAFAQEVATIVGADPVAVGDNLVTEGVDLRALAEGDRLAVGSAVVLRRSGRAHRPCVPFRERTSPEAFRAVAQADARGALFYAERGGPVRVGDPIRVIRAKSG